MAHEGPYRQPASPRTGATDPAAPLARQALLVAATGVLLVLLAAPVLALAAQPFSFYATLVTGVLATLTAVTLLRIGFAAS
ncbi:MAG: hypothetical protein ABSE49_16745 [Polyangiaceae bacterium]